MNSATDASSLPAGPVKIVPALLPGVSLAILVDQLKGVGKLEMRLERIGFLLVVLQDGRVEVDFEC